MLQEGSGCSPCGRLTATGESGRKALLSGEALAAKISPSYLKVYLI